MKHVVDAPLLMDYAAGSLAEPVALAVATHLSLNDEAREDYARLAVVGGALLDQLHAEDMADDALDAVMARLDEPGEVTVSAPVLDDETRAVVPEPLQPYLGRPLADLAWKKKGNGVEEYRFAGLPDGFRVSLLRIEPGRAMPHHTHRGCEYTVVLDGAYTDGDQVIGRGDFCEADGKDNHQPVADPEKGCMCLIVLDQPVKLTGPLGWVVNPFLKN